MRTSSRQERERLGDIYYSLETTGEDNIVILKKNNMEDNIICKCNYNNEKTSFQTFTKHSTTYLTRSIIIH